MPDENVQHNLNADVDIEFSSGLASLEDFAARVSDLNAEFERWSNTTTSLEERIRKSFDLLTKNVGRADTTTEAIDSKVMSVIQREIDRAISDYVDGLDFRKALFQHGDIRETERNLKKTVQRFYRSLNKSIDTSFQFMGEVPEGLLDETENLKSSVKETFDKILFDSSSSFTKKVEAVKAETSRLSEEVGGMSIEGEFASEVAELRKNIQSEINNYSKNILKDLEAYESAVKTHAKSSPLTDLSTKAVENIRNRIKDAVVESLEIKITKGSLNIKLGKEALDNIKSSLSSAVSNVISKGFVIDFEEGDSSDGLKLSKEAFNTIWEEAQKKFSEIIIDIDLSDISNLSAFDTNEFYNKVDEIKASIRKYIFNYMENFNILDEQQVTETKKKKAPKTRKVSTIQADIDATTELISQSEAAIELISKDQKEILEKLTSQLKEGEKKLALLNAELKKAEEAPIEQRVTKRKKVLIPKEVTDRFVDRVSKSLTELIDTISVDGIEQVKEKLQKDGLGFEKLAAMVESINDSISVEKLEKLQAAVDDFMAKLTTEVANTLSVKPKKGKKKVTKPGIVDDIVSQIIKDIEEAIKSIDIEVVQTLSKRIKDLFDSFKVLSSEIGKVWDEEKSSILNSLLPLQKAIAEIGNGFEDITNALVNIKDSSFPDMGGVSKKMALLGDKFKNIDRSMEFLSKIEDVEVSVELAPFKDGLSKIGDGFNSLTELLKDISTSTMGGLQSSVASFKSSLDTIAKGLSSPEITNEGKIDPKIYQEVYKDQILRTLKKERIGSVSLREGIAEGRNTFDDIREYLKNQMLKDSKNKSNFLKKLQRTEEILSGESDLVSGYKNKKWSYITKEEIHKNLVGDVTFAIDKIKDTLTQFSQLASQMARLKPSDTIDVSAIKDIYETMNKIRDSFKVVNTALEDIIYLKQIKVDAQVIFLKLHIKNLGQSFSDMNAALENSGIVGLKAAIDKFASEFQKITEAAKQIDAKLPTEELKNSILELRKEFRNAENGTTAAKLVMGSVNAKIAELVTSLQELSAKVINVDAETLNIKLTQEQLDSLDAQIGGIKILNVNEASEPVSNAIKRLLENAGTLIEQNISGTMDPKSFKIPKRTTNKIISTLSKMTSNFVDGFINSLASQLVAPTFEVSTAALPKGVKASLAQKANMAVADYVKQNPKVGGPELISYMMEKSMYDISTLFYQKTRQNQKDIVSQYLDGIKNIKVAYDNSPIEYMIDRVESVQTSIINKIKEIMSKQFNHIEKEIKAMKVAPIGFNYIPTDAKRIAPTKTKVVKSFGAETAVPRGNIDIQIPYRVGSDMDISSLYSKAGGAGGNRNSALLNSILSTVRYIMAGTLLRAPMGALRQGWQSSRQLELALTKVANNLQGLTVEENRSYTDRRIEKIFELGLQNQFDYLKELSEDDARDREYYKISQLINGGLRKDIQALSLQYIIPQESVGEMFQYASRSTRNPYEALALTEAATKLYAAEPDIGTPEDVAKKLQSLSVIWGVSGFDMGKYASMIYSAGTQVTASGQDLLSGLVRGGPSLRQAMSGGVMEHPELNALREQIAKEIDEETKRRLMVEYDKLEKEITFSYALPLIGLFEEATSRTGSETGRAYEQIFRALRSPDVYKAFDRLLEGRPELEYLRPYTQVKDPTTGIVQNVAKNQVQVLVDFLDALPELRKADARETDELLVRITGRYSGAFEALTSVIKEFSDKWPEYSEDEGGIFSNWAEAIRAASDEKLNQDILALNETQTKRIQQIPVMWGIALDEVMANFSEEVNLVVDTIMTMLRAVHDNASTVATIFKSLVNVLIGYGIRTVGGKAIDSANSKFLAEERDRLVEPWKERMQEAVSKRFETQKSIMDQEEKLEKASTIYEENRKKYFDLTGISLDKLSDTSTYTPRPTTVRGYLEANDENVERALLALYSLQTETEQATEQTSETNHVGFNLADGKSLPKYAKKLIAGEKLTPAEIRHVRQRLMKYSGQLAYFGEDLFNSDTDIRLVTNEGGALGQIGKLRQYEQELSKTIDFVNSVNWISAYINEPNAVLNDPKPVLINKVERHLEDMYKLVDADLEVDLLRQLLAGEAGPITPEEEDELKKELQAVIEELEKQLGIDTFKKSLQAYKESDIDFSQLPEDTLKSLIRAHRSGGPLSMDISDRLEIAQSDYKDTEMTMMAYERQYGADSKEATFARKRLDEIGKRIDLLERGRLSNTEIEEIEKQLKEVSRISMKPENLSYNLDTLNRLRDQIVILENEAEQSLRKSNQALDTYSAVASRKAKMLKTLNDVDEEMLSIEKTISNIMSAYSDMGATSKKGEKEGTTRGGIKTLLEATKFKDKTSSAKSSFVDTLRHYGITMLPSEIISVLDSGDPDKIKDKFGASSPLITKAWELLTDADDTASHYIKNMTRQEEIKERLNELRGFSGLPPVAFNKLKKKADEDSVITELTDQLEAMSEVDTVVEVKALTTELANLRTEADKLATSSRSAATAQAELNEAQMRANAEFEAGGSSEDYLKKTKEAQDFQEKSIGSSILSSIALGFKGMLINWAIGAVTTFITGTIAEAIQPKDIKARRAYEAAKEMAVLMDSDKEGQKFWARVGAFLFQGNPALNEFFGLPDLRPDATARLEISQAKSPEEREAIVKKYLEDYYAASKETNISETRMNTLAEKMIIDAFASPGTEAESFAASLEAIQTAIEYWESWLSTLTAINESEYTLNKFEATLNGLSVNSNEMIQIEKEFAQKQLEHYEEALAGVEAMIRQSEILLAGGADKVQELADKAGLSFDDMLTTLRNDPKFKLKKADSEILKLLEAEKNSIIKAITGYRDTLENVFTEFSKNLSYISEVLTAETAEAEIIASRNRLNRWMGGIPDYSDVAVGQELQALYDKAIADRRAAETARNEFEQKIKPVLEAEMARKYQEATTLLTSPNAPPAEEVAKRLENVRETYRLKEAEVLQLETTANESMLQYSKSLEEMPYTASETIMNMAAGRADVEARIAIAQAQLRGLGEDSLFERIITRQRLEEQNIAFGLRIKDLEEIIRKGSPNSEKYRIEILELLAKQNENLVAIRKLNENRVSFGLPDGLMPITYNSILQSTATDRTFSGQRGNINVTVTFDHANFADPNSIRRVERDLTDAINRAVNRAMR